MQIEKDTDRDRWEEGGAGEEEGGVKKRKPKRGSLRGWGKEGVIKTKGEIILDDNPY